jgi:hypothetical protein
MKDTSKPTRASRSVGKLLYVVHMFLFVSLGFVLGMASISKFPNMIYTPFVASLPFPTPPPPPTPSPPRPPPLPATPLLPAPRNLGLGMALMDLLAPSGVIHNMTDEELFWRASMAPKGHRTPYHRVPKIAFLFLVRGELPLRPLWEKFFAGNDQELYSIYVHPDPSYTGSPPRDSVFYGRMIPSKVRRSKIL